MISNAGDVVLVVESDKADMDVETFEDGFLARIITPEGGSAAVGSVVAQIVDTVEEIASIGSAPAPASEFCAATFPVASTPEAQALSAAAAKELAHGPGATAPSVAYESVLMPALSSTMKEGKIVSWSKKVGDKVNSGDMVLVVESDKADMDVESFEEGYLAAILVKDGEVAEVGAPVAYLAKSQADIPAVQAMASSGAAPVSPVSGSASVAPTPSSSSPAAPVSPAPQVVNSGRVAATGYAQAVAKEQGVDLRTVTPSRPDGLITAMDVASGAPAMPTAWVPTAGTINATPMARKLAAENNIQLSGVKGTGNFGRVTADDVLIAAGKKVVKVEAPKSAPAAAAAPSKEKETKVLDGVVPMDGMQKAVAKNMEKTLSVPIFRVSREIVTDEFDALYAALKPKGVTVSAMLAKAVAETLKKHPIMNAAYVEGGIKYNKDVNVAMAVAMDGGLITPTIVGAQDLDLFSISRKWKELVDKAKNKKLSPAEYSSGTFTISNLGMFGVQQFDAILPTGTGSILAIAASTPKVVQLKNGHFGVRKSMTVTITCDHRHIYGADAAEFLKDLAGKNFFQQI